MAQEWAKAFYNGKLWKQQRLHILDRDNYSCAECGKRAEEVHHIVWLTEQNITDYSISLSPDNLISLCHNCHTRLHKGSDTEIKQGFKFDSHGYPVPAYSPPKK